MFDTILDLPVHPLAVHAAVIIIPTAALAVGLAALWPRFRTRAGLLPLILSAAALGLTPITVQSGRALAERLDESALVQRHSELGEDLLPWVVALTLAAAGLAWLRRREMHQSHSAGSATSRIAVLTVAIFATLSATGTAVQVARIGHSGSEAAWSEVTKEAALGSPAGTQH